MTSYGKCGGFTETVNARSCINLSVHTPIYHYTGQLMEVAVIHMGHYAQDSLYILVPKSPPAHQCTTQVFNPSSLSDIEALLTNILVRSWDE